MRCSRCDFENEYGAAVCSQCGEPFVQTIEQQFNSQSNEPVEFVPEISKLPQNFEVPKEEDIIKLSDMGDMGGYDFENRSKKARKITGIIVAAILIIALCLGAAYAFAPRDVLQLLLSDEKYAQLTIGKNMLAAFDKIDEKSSILNQKSSRTYDAGINMNFTSDFMKEMGEDPSFAATVVYLNSLRIKGTKTVDGLVSKDDISVLDRSGELIGFSLISDKSVNYVNGVKSLIKKDVGERLFSFPGYTKVNSISSDWLTFSEAIIAPGDFQKILSITEDMDDQKKQASKGLKNVMVSFFDVCFEKGLEDIESSKQLSIGAAIADGDKISFSVSPEQFKKASKEAIKTAKEDPDLFQSFKEMYDAVLKNDPDLAVRINGMGIKMDKAGYKAFLDEMLKNITESMDKAIWGKVTVDLYVNKNNQIVGVQMGISPKSTDISVGKIRFVLPSAKGNKNFGALFTIGKFEARMEVVQKTETSGTTMIYAKDDKLNFLINSRGTYKNVKIEDGMLFGEIKQNMDLMYVEESKQETDKIKVTFKSEKDGEVQKISTSTTYEEIGTIGCDLTVTKNKFEAIDIPKIDTVIDMNSLEEEDADKIETVYMSYYKYLFETLPASHPDLVNVFAVVFGDNSLFEGFDAGSFVDGALTT